MYTQNRVYAVLTPQVFETIEAPALTYPSGYTATVTNGWVTSPPCAELLTVAAQPGAATVTVGVQPGGACP